MKIVHSSLKCIQNISCGGKRRGGGLESFLRNCWNSSKILRLHAFIINTNTMHLPKAKSVFFLTKENDIA
jgi:hypothetical protein